MIKPIVLFLGIVFFIFIFIIHIFYWRILKPKSHIKNLFINFIVVPAPIVFLIIYFSIYNPIFGINFLDILFSAVLYLAIAGGYIQTYPPIQAWSPSLYIVFNIGKEKNTVTVDELKKTVDENKLINDRFNDLSDEGLITINEKEEVFLTLKGKILSNLFYYYRSFLGLKEGEG